LAELLDDPRWTVRDRAVHQLGKRGADAAAILRDIIQQGTTARIRRNGVWALTRIETTEARAALREALADKDGSVRLAAAHAVGLNRDAEGLARFKNLAV